MPEQSPRFHRGRRKIPHGDHAWKIFQAGEVKFQLRISRERGRRNEDRVCWLRHE